LLAVAPKATRMVLGAVATCAGKLRFRPRAGILDEADPAQERTPPGEHIQIRAAVDTGNGWVYNPLIT
jgi:hypothetical protein